MLETKLFNSVDMKFPPFILLTKNYDCNFFSLLHDEIMERVGVLLPAVFIYLCLIKNTLYGCILWLYGTICDGKTTSAGFVHCHYFLCAICG